MSGFPRRAQHARSTDADVPAAAIREECGTDSLSYLQHALFGFTLLQLCSITLAHLSPFESHPPRKPLEATVIRRYRYGWAPSEALPSVSASLISWLVPSYVPALTSPMSDVHFRTFRTFCGLVLVWTSLKIPDTKYSQNILKNLVLLGSLWLVGSLLGSTSFAWDSVAAEAFRQTSFGRPSSWDATAACIADCFRFLQLVWDLLSAGLSWCFAATTKKHLKHQIWTAKSSLIYW